jgi:hypothetical protein
VVFIWSYSKRKKSSFFFQKLKQSFQETVVYRMSHLRVWSITLRGLKAKVSKAREINEYDIANELSNWYTMANGDSVHFTYAEMARMKASLSKWLL